MTKPKTPRNAIPLTTEIGWAVVASATGRIFRAGDWLVLRTTREAARQMVHGKYRRVVKVLIVEER